MVTEVRTPFSVSSIELADGGLWRKQVLKFGTIWYTDRTGQRRQVTFDGKYGRDLIKAFKQGAFPQVPFQFADSDNRHNNDPTRTAGEVVGVELSADGSGVDAILRTWGEGTRVVEQNPKLGVSARILENTPQPDGRMFPRALQHILATVDPQVRGMHPWERVQSVDLSNGMVPDSLDLSTETYERGAEVSGDGKVTLELSADQAARLTQLLDEDEALEALAEQLGEDFLDDLDEEDETEDAEDDLDEDEDEEEDVALSGRHAEALELAMAQQQAQSAQIIELTNRLNQTRTENEMAEFQRQGLAPAITELARPLLAFESGAIELSNGVAGAAIDPGEVIREVLNAVIELSNSGHLMVDMAETGSLEGNDTVNDERQALLADWANYS